MRIEIGCGNTPREGYITCDVAQHAHVDHVCSADDLPFNNESVCEIFSRHLVEHFTFREFLSVLVEWNRVLKPKGALYIICPNLLWHLQQILSGDHHSFFNKKSGENNRYWGFGSLFGWQQDGYDVHKFGYYFELIRDVLHQMGFDRIEDLTASDRGLENAPWHLEVRAIKHCKAPDPQALPLFHHFDVKH
ncbi:MAG: methyltransferase domain-containing protein [Salibacteraceae bacterium]